ncbi:MAG TPA: beta-N-acetylhexosaminidase [Galbitalea sp.]|jgi:beta-N-acetylhexosaminidase
MSAAATLLPGFAGPTLPAWLETRLRDGLAGVCLFATNIESRSQLRGLTDAIRAANPFALIAIDEEGGDVTRLYSDQGSPYPGNALLGRIDDLDFTRALASTVGWELRHAGVNLNLAPDVDINSNSSNPVIGTRSFGTDPELVARHTGAWVEGLQSTGVAASAKHFPGHGDTAEDSHLALPVVDRDLAELSSRELRPFEAAIAAGSLTIMTSHILLPRVDAENPATLSRGILQGILREDLGYTGLIVTDALDMKGASGATGIPEAAVRALAAGSDLLCIGPNNTDDQLEGIQDAIERAVSGGRLAQSRVDEAAGRNLELARQLIEATASLPVPDWAEAGERPQFPAELIRAAFDVRSGVTPPRNPIILTIETTANIAVGASPWGLAAAGFDTVPIPEGGRVPDPGADAGAATLVIVGKDNHRRQWVRELIDAARARYPATLVVDMGWPSEDRLYADVATFGSSRVAGLVLAGWLGLRDRAATSSNQESRTAT